MEAKTPLLQVHAVGKRFPGVVALDGVSLEIYPGEVLSIIGENGAGKSTLMKILAGIQPPDDGTLSWEGKAVRIENVSDAQELGIALIHQELYLCENLSLAENVYLGREPQRFGFVDRRRMELETEKHLRSVGLNLPPDTLAGELTIGQQQMVEIAKAVSTDSRIIIMDEPTSSLSQKESENLFEIIFDLKKRGVSVVYISHRLGEVEMLSDRVVALRDGKNAGELNKDEINYANMVQKMIGRELSNYYSRHPKIQDTVALCVENLRTPQHPRHEVSFQLKAGEIVGMAGLVGAGRTELLTTLFGVTPAVGGKLSVFGRELDIQDTRAAIANGLALVPEDRKLQGVVLPMSVRENTLMAMLPRLTRFGLIDFREGEKIAQEMKQQLRIKTPHTEQPVKFLSGGNQQKVVIAKWLANGMKILLMDEPTRGVDVGAKEEIYRLMDELAQDGVAILFVSSDMEEVIGMSDRMLVMHEGRLTGELQKNEFSETAVMELATGAIGMSSSSK
ncbi:MAG: sugar ABC transporter ATP-binding protein [Pirellulaceae bacterium]